MEKLRMAVKSIKQQKSKEIKRLFHLTSKMRQNNTLKHFENRTYKKR